MSLAAGSPPHPIGAPAAARRDGVADQNVDPSTTDLRGGQERLRTAFEALMDPIEILDAVRDDQGRLIDFRFRYVNPALERAVGRSADELVGRRVGELYPDMATALKQLWADVVRTGNPLVLDGFPLATPSRAGSDDSTCAAHA